MDREEQEVVGQTTTIEWTDASWNPVRGCSRVSEGCRNCYAETFAARFARPSSAGPYVGFVQLTTFGPRWTGRVELIEKHLRDPLHLKKPQRIFVNSMSDLFHEALPDEAIDRVFAVMALCPQHTFQILTKRPERMLKYFEDRPLREEIIGIQAELESGLDRHLWGAECEAITGCGDDGIARWRLPLPNVWLGVSVEDQKTADERIPLLLRTPAVVRFVSYEPALGPILHWDEWLGCGHRQYEDVVCPECGAARVRGTWLDWVIVGGESGHGARPFDIGWARNTVEQCKEAGVACFVKQLGAAPYAFEKIGTSKRVWPHSPSFPERVRPEKCDVTFQTRILTKLRDKKGGDWDEWPEDLRVREFPAPQNLRGAA